MRPLKILFISSEAIPFSKTGGLADVSGSLPKALCALGHDVRVVTPYYRCVYDGKFNAEKIHAGVRNEMPSEKMPFDILLNQDGGVKTYFIRNDAYFFRKGIYGNIFGDYPDNALRYAFFSRAAIRAVEAEAFVPDVIHCNDWQTALVPFYLKFKLSDRSLFSNTKVLFTIHNMSYQGIFKNTFRKQVGITDDFFTMSTLEFYGKINFMKAGILYADAISTVSKRYAEEIETHEFGCGLEGVIHKRKKDLCGIVNGVDYDEWSPEKDKHIKVNYGVSDLEKKIECKKDLLAVTGLKTPIDRPIIGAVTRLVPQKGMDMVAEIIEDIVGMNVGFVILGNGSMKYTGIFSRLARKYHGNVFVAEGFNDPLAHKIEAGCDMYVMPSRFEPCGLNQMYSIKYGTIPIVRATGGLDDVIVDFNQDERGGNGFKFVPEDKEALLETIKRAVSVFENKEAWRRLMIRAMAYDFSWEQSAKEYVSLYERMLAG